jgi:hypothetical protein
VASQLTVTAKIGDFLVDMSVNSALTVEGNTITGIFIPMPGVFAQSTNANISADAVSNQTSTATLNVQGNITGNAVSDLNTSAEQSTNAVKTVDAQISIGGALAFDATVRATKNNEIAVFVDSAVTVTGTVTRTTTSTLTSDFAQSAAVGKIVVADSALSSEFTLNADGKLLLIEQYVYIIPREQRSYAIRKEDREHIIRG